MKSFYDVIPFHATHAQSIRVQDAQRGVVTEQIKENEKIWDELENNERSWTLMHSDKPKVIAIAGIIPQWPGRAVAWAVLSSGMSTAEFVRVSRAIIHGLDYYQEVKKFYRIETNVYEEFPQGHRWARRLGFEPEGLMREYRPGEDHRMYARIA